MSIDSSQVNALIVKYLQESGFSHSAFVFKNECRATDEQLNNGDDRRGVLISFLQKGLIYSEIETHITADGAEVVCTEPFTLTKQHSCKDLTPALSSSSAQASGALPSFNAKSNSQSVLDNEVGMLKAHTKEVFACQWNPKHPKLLASGSADSTAVLWHIPDSPAGPSMGASASQNHKVLRHFAGDGSMSRDVTTLSWSGDGDTLATGSYDGNARIWNLKGELVKTLTGHAGPIFSLRWTTDSKFLLSGGVDRTARIWDATTGSMVQKFDVHSAPTLDVSWKDDKKFATCSTDKTISICEKGTQGALMRFTEHTDEVNAVTWSPDSQILASCSDDKSIRLWKLDSQKSCQRLLQHEREIYTIRWRPAGPGSRNPNLNTRMLSASFDGTARLWDVETGACVTKFPRHKQPVYAISFSPDGKYCVVGSFDKSVEVFDVDQGLRVQSYLGPGGVFDVDWQDGGSKISIATSKGTVVVMDRKK